MGEESQTRRPGQITGGVDIGIFQSPFFFSWQGFLEAPPATGDRENNLTALLLGSPKGGTSLFPTWAEGEGMSRARGVT